MKQVGRKAQRPVQRPLLGIEERAVLIADVDHQQTEEGGAEARQLEGCCVGFCRKRSWYSVCCDIGSISIMVTVVLTLIGVLLLVLARVLEWPVWVDRLSQYIISAGVFGMATGGTNAIAVFMLLYRVPFLCGTGVFYRKHGQIKNVIRLIVLQQLFSSEHLQTYISKKIRQFSSHVQVTESIMKALESTDTALLINQRLDQVFAEPEAQFLEALGVGRKDIEEMIRPAILSLCAETAPYVLDNMQQSQLDRPKAISVPRFRKEMDLYLTWRIEELTQQRIGVLMRDLMQLHLGWVVVWGCVLGALSGIVTQGVRVSLNFNFL